MAATNAPNVVSGTAQTSTSIAAPLVLDKTSPGFCGTVPFNAYKRYSAEVVQHSSRNARTEVS